jgi:anaerobic selenocysteine-containing dehydrogenase
MYEPLWIHTSEAQKRGIRNGDIVKVFNERGIVLAGAYVTERLRPGVATWTTAPATIPSRPVRSSAAGPSTPFPRKGSRPKTVWVKATSGYLVQVEQRVRRRDGPVAAGLPRGI